MGIDKSDVMEQTNTCTYEDVKGYVAFHDSFNGDGFDKDAFAKLSNIVEVSIYSGDQNNLDRLNELVSELTTFKEYVENMVKARGFLDLRGLSVTHGKEEDAYRATGFNSENNPIRLYQPYTNLVMKTLPNSKTDYELLNSYLLNVIDTLDRLQNRLTKVS